MTHIPLFWQRWLMAATIGAMGFGLAFIFAPGLMETFFNALLFSETQAHTRFSAEALGYMRFVYGVLGAVMAGWMLCLLILVVGPFRRGDRSAWLAIAVSSGFWFVIDSAFSVASGYWQNAALNVGFAVLFAVPLAATFRHFFRPVER